MSPLDYKSSRINKSQARKQISKILSLYPRNVWFSKHALEELKADDLVTTDAFNVLKSPDSRIYQEGELENGSYRYRLETGNILLVIAFQEDGNGLTVVTGWDKRKRIRENKS